MDRPRSAAASRAIAYGLAGLVFLLDRLTKYVIQQQVLAGDSYTVIPGFFSIVHNENPGAAFSLFSGAQSEWRSFFLVGLTAGAGILIGVLLWHPGGRVGESRRMRLGLALILGGALGNVFDRIASRTVTDFLDFYLGALHWPAFNLADSAITVGAALLIIDMIRSRRRVPKT
ncbi:MAG: signal peptidase II [Bryobacteraceae bacterium]|jgi:signal peptidase II